MFLKSGMTQAEKSTFNMHLDLVLKSVRKIFESPVSRWTGRGYHLKGSHADFLGTMMARETRRILEFVFQIITEASPKEKENLSQSTIKEGVQIMNIILIDVMQLEILSNKHLSQFLNKSSNAQIILSHAFKNLLIKRDRGDGFVYPHISINYFINCGKSMSSLESEIIKSE
jgi:hypothetical protein